jgi:hypothetical protein
MADNSFIQMIGLSKDLSSNFTNFKIKNYYAS